MPTLQATRNSPAGPVIIVMNKWDLALEAAAEKAERELEHANSRMGQCRCVSQN